LSNQKTPITIGSPGTSAICCRIIRRLTSHLNATRFETERFARARGCPINAR
jgi:hypothetical protein